MAWGYRRSVLSALLVASALVLTGATVAAAQPTANYVPITPQGNASTAVQKLQAAFSGKITLPAGISNLSLALLTVDANGNGSLTTQIKPGQPLLLVIPGQKLPGNTEGYLTVIGSAANKVVVAPLGSSSSLSSSDGQLFGGKGSSVSAAALQTAQFGPITTNADGSLSLALTFPEGGSGDYQLSVAAGNASVSASLKVTEPTKTTTKLSAQHAADNSYILWIIAGVIVLAILAVWLIVSRRRKRQATTPES